MSRLLPAGPGCARKGMGVGNGAAGRVGEGGSEVLARGGVDGGLFGSDEGWLTLLLVMTMSARLGCMASPRCC